MFQGVVIYGHFTARREMDIPPGRHGDCTVITIDVCCPSMDILSGLYRDAAFGIYRRTDFRLPLRPQIVILIQGHILTSMQCLC
ncbi:MAG: hypothetical protein SOU02_05855 [Caecibacter massiliensis]|nr:hypothetical protein [Caecibacter massiliensis]